MSKLKRKHQDSGSSTTEHSASATEGCGFESRPECQPEVTPESESGVDSKLEALLPVLQDEIVAEQNAPLAKVEVNDDTPRCPFCRGVRVEQLPAMLQGFNRWSCLDCRKTFRAPISETQRRRSA